MAKVIPYSVFRYRKELQELEKAVQIAEDNWARHPSVDELIGRAKDTFKNDRRDGE